jgi:hypothetical protein
MRMRRLVETLTGRSVSGVATRVLPEMPPALAQFEAEGSILLVTRVERSCQFVYGVEASAWPGLRRRLEDPTETVASLEQALRDRAVGLGRVDHYASSEDVLEGDTSVAEFFAKAFPDRVPTAVWSWTTAFATDDERRLVVARAEALARRLGGSVSAGLLRPRADLPTECDAVTVVVVDSSGINSETIAKAPPAP